MTFIIIGCVGLAILALSLVLGDLFDLSGHFDGILGSDLFSTAAIASFLGAFGFAGFAAQKQFGLGVAIAVGLVVGVIVGYGAMKLTRALQRDPGTPSLNTSTMVGLSGTVISAIPAGGFGEIRLSTAGHTLKLNARSHTDIAQGTEVWVSGVISATAVEVRSTELTDLEPPAQLQP